MEFFALINSTNPFKILALLEPDKKPSSAGSHLVLHSLWKSPKIDTGFYGFNMSCVLRSEMLSQIPWRQQGSHFQIF